MYNNTYLHNLQNLCIIKVQGGVSKLKQHKICVEVTDLQKKESINKININKTFGSWLYESYFRDTK
jgi:hypothetical protein